MKFMNKFIRKTVILLIVFGIGAFLIFRSGVTPWRANKMTSASKAVYYCPMHPTYTSDRPGDCPICNMKLVKKDLPPEEAMSLHEGHAPAQVLRTFTVQELLKMKPGEICLLHKCKMGTCMIAMTEEIARLGKCPHCGEDLGVAIKDIAPSGYAQVKMAPEKQQLIGIKMALVTKTDMTKTIRTTGRIAHDPELYQAEEEYVQAVESLKKAEASNIPEIREQAAKLVESSAMKLRLMGLSKELIEEIEMAGAADRSLLHSEAGGKVWLYAPIYEYEIPLVKIGDHVEVEVPAVSGKKFQGVIRAIDPVLDPMTRSVRVRATLDNPEGHLKHEMYVNATLQINLGELLTVPEEAVFATGEKNILFVAKPDGVFEPREVAVGASSEGLREIKSGVAEGETVVVSGNFLIDSESRLKGALEGMGTGGHQHGQ